MSLITFGLADLTLLTMGLGIGFRITMSKSKVTREVEAPKEIEFVNLPVEIDFEKKEVEK